MQLKIGYLFQCPPRATPWVVRCYKHTPCKGKSFKVLVMKLLPLQGALMVAVCTQGVALG